MLAPLVALQLVALGQAAVAAPAQAAPTTAEAPASAAPPAQAQPAPPAKVPAAPARSAGPQLASLVSAEPLDGSSALLGWAGWSTLGAAWGQGVTAADDLGAFGDLDWTTSEMRLGGWWRRALASTGAVRVSGRLSASWYLDFGTHWAHDGNHGDRGLQISPALLVSAPGGGGVFTVGGELPLTWTVWHGGGILFQPRLTGAYETALYDPVTIGVRASLGARAGSGGAPIQDAQGQFEFLVLAGYRLF